MYFIWPDFVSRRILFGRIFLEDFFWGFKMRTSYLGVNNPSISVFKSFLFIKSSYTQKKSGKKIRENPKKLKNPKNLKKTNKPMDFFEDLKSVHPIWEWTTLRFYHWNGTRLIFTASLNTLHHQILPEVLHAEYGGSKGSSNAPCPSMNRISSIPFTSTADHSILIGRV